MVKSDDNGATNMAEMSNDDASKASVEAGFAVRLAEIIYSKGDKPAAAARAMGVNRQTLQQWMTGRSIPRADVALSICERYGMDLAYLITGQPAHGAGDLVQVPRFDLQASAAGRARALVPENLTSPTEVIGFSATWLRRLGVEPQHAEMLVAVGDSMEPTIRDGDMMLLNRGIRAVETSGIYVVTISGMIVVKRAFVRLSGDLVLKSDNPIYPEEVVPLEDLHSVTIEGRVRWTGRSI